MLSLSLSLSLYMCVCVYLSPKDLRELAHEYSTPSYSLA